MAEALLAQAQEYRSKQPRLSQLMIEAALNAAINVIRGVVNRTIGFALL